MGFEPTTFAMARRHSTAELRPPLLGFQRVRRTHYTRKIPCDKIVLNFYKHPKFRDDALLYSHPIHRAI